MATYRGENVVPLANVHHPGGGDGGGGDMDERVGRLEVDMRDVKAVLNDTVVPVLARIDERLNHTATKAELQGVRADLDGKIADLDHKMDGKLNDLERTIDGKLTDLEGRWNDKLANLEGRLSGTLTDLEGRWNDKLAGLEVRWNDRLTDLHVRLAEKPGKGFIVGTALTIVVGGITLIAATIAGMQYLQTHF
ncbi:hypothetical protein [uncultured Rhodospira sp.]|uniref:hypothetical protein n=1 Tax=uncultured Rhodospira sp. TaxID=1936189 RepID=UPI0026053D3E|nr:hypothetical protein [uncultured Rhodospira sp.]